MDLKEDKKEDSKIVVEKKAKKTFKEYYADPEFKARHLAHLKADVLCTDCNCYVKRYNVGHHRKSQKHTKNIKERKEQLTNISQHEILALIEKLQKLL